MGVLILALNAFNAHPCLSDLQVYNQIYNTTVSGNGGTTALNYTSPILHTVVLTGLPPSTKYYYQVGDGTTYSPTFNFTSLAFPSKSNVLSSSSSPSSYRSDEDVAISRLMIALQFHTIYVYVGINRNGPIQRR